MACLLRGHLIAQLQLPNRAKMTDFATWSKRENGWQMILLVLWMEYCSQRNALINGSSKMPCVAAMIVTQWWTMCLHKAPMMRSFLLLSTFQGVGRRVVWRLFGNSNFWFQFTGPPSEAEFWFRFWFRRFQPDFFLIPLLENWQIGILIPKFGIPEKNMQALNTPHFVPEKRLPPYLHLLKMVAAIPASTQNGYRHTYIYSKWCRHTYIYSKQLPPYLHLLKMVAAISTSTENGCCHAYIYSKGLPPYLHLLKTVAAIVGTLNDGYVCNVPLPRGPQIQSTSHVTCYRANMRDTVTEPGTNTDTCYSQVAHVPMWGNIMMRLLAGLDRCVCARITPFSPGWLM